ncbi:family 43 glycosylhydrolase [Sphingobacterium suaedae]|uniref:Family 43 glycosylhydrolase n=1 Tax=Sphingobacterium suaedae TaxID=1686402 RepID=A0ABW5KKV0_9SPHI
MVFSLLNTVRIRTLFHSMVAWLCCMWFPACAPSVVPVDNASAKQVYQNPVFVPVLADPTVILDSASGFFYAYGTEDNWGDGKGSRLVPVLRSGDLIEWTYVGEAFPSKPSWKKAGGLWAPEVDMIDGKYYMYYSFSTWGDANPGIGLAIADKPEGPFRDQGAILTSKGIDVPNSIDPSFFQENGKKYLLWGSFDDGPRQGIHLVELDAKGLKVQDRQKKVKLAAGDWEAPMIHLHEGYYYFFGSKGSCCEGARSTYHVRVARSKHLLGPYLDRDGHPITERGRGTMLLHGSHQVAGPGHHAKLIRDDAGDDWLLYHGIYKDEDKVSSGASRRTLMLDKLTWNDGWPEIEGATPSTTKKQAPILKHKKS